MPTSTCALQASLGSCPDLVNQASDAAMKHGLLEMMRGLEPRSQELLGLAEHLWHKAGNCKAVGFLLSVEPSRGWD